MKKPEKIEKSSIFDKKVSLEITTKSNYYNKYMNRVV